MGKSYKQLSIEERTMVQTKLAMGIKLGAIALELGRSASTLSRELSRKRMGSAEGSVWVWAQASAAGGRLSFRCSASTRPCRHNETARCAPAEAGTPINAP